MTPDLLALSRAYHLRILKLDLWDVSRYQCVNRWSDCMGFNHYVPESRSAFRLLIVVVWLQRSRLKYGSVKIENSKWVILLQQRLLLSTPTFDLERILRWLMYSILWLIGSSMLPCKSCSCSLTTNHTHVTLQTTFFSFQCTNVFPEAIYDSVNLVWRC